MKDHELFEMHANRLGLKVDRRLYLFWQAARSQEGGRIPAALLEEAREMLREGESSDHYSVLRDIVDANDPESPEPPQEPEKLTQN